MDTRKRLLKEIKHHIEQAELHLQGGTKNEYDYNLNQAATKIKDLKEYG